MIGVFALAGWPPAALKRHADALAADLRAAITGWFDQPVDSR